MDERALIEGIAGKSVAALGDSLPDEVRGRTPEELDKIVKIFTAYAKDLHQDPTTGEIRSLTSEEQAAFDYALEVRNAAEERLRHHNQVSEIFRRETPSVKRVYAQIRRGLDGGDSVARLTVAEARDEALRRLEDRSAASHLKPDEQDEVDRVVRRSTDVARRILVTENEHYRSAFAKAITDPWGPAKWTEEERAAMLAWDEYRAMSSSSGDGGYGIPVERELVAA